MSSNRRSRSRERHSNSSRHYIQDSRHDSYKRRDTRRDDSRSPISRDRDRDRDSPRRDNRYDDTRKRSRSRSRGNVRADRDGRDSRRVDLPVVVVAQQKISAPVKTETKFEAEIKLIHEERQKQAEASLAVDAGVRLARFDYEMALFEVDKWEMQIQTIARVKNE